MDDRRQVVAHEHHVHAGVRAVAGRVVGQRLAGRLLDRERDVGLGRPSAISPAGWKPSSANVLRRRRARAAARGAAAFATAAGATSVAPATTNAASRRDQHPIEATIAPCLRGGPSHIRPVLAAVVVARRLRRRARRAMDATRLRRRHRGAGRDPGRDRRRAGVRPGRQAPRHAVRRQARSRAAFAPTSSSSPTASASSSRPAIGLERPRRERARPDRRRRAAARAVRTLDPTGVIDFDDAGPHARRPLRDLGRPAPATADALVQRADRGLRRREATSSNPRLTDRGRSWSSSVATSRRTVIHVPPRDHARGPA